MQRTISHDERTSWALQIGDIVSFCDKERAARLSPVHTQHGVTEDGAVQGGQEQTSRTRTD